jgi:hypothetical protein
MLAFAAATDIRAGTEPRAEKPQNRSAAAPMRRW